MRFEFQEGHRHGDPQGSAAAARRAGQRRDARARGRRSTRRRAQALDRVLAWVTSQKGHGMDLGLKGKVAMVGGASRGLGFAVAEALAREGAIVSISSSNEASIDDAARRLSARRRARSLGTAVDVRNGDQIDRLGGRRRSSGSAASICCSPTPAVRPPARRCRSTMRRGRTRSICCCSARSAWCGRRCRR